MPDTALLVIDVQESFRHRPYWDEADLPRFLDRQQALIDGAVAQNVPVVQVFHVEDSPVENPGPFSLASGHVRPLEPLRIAPDAVFHKRRHSALVGSGLDVWLTRNGIRRLIVSGIRTEQCCETTTRHASDLGYGVDYVAEATLTFAMTDAAGRRWSAEEIRARTELVLAGRFARIATVEEALSGPAPRLAA
ncbi:isochorismatase family protein [Methylobacterium sp. SyP6R]|uniref:isochorismatase family protein n=1 Tax=Methylobacterium sp. SyP6R TaxID=2718876 RepID=UPI001F48C25C|nr:isochorismatase family protein [Methylobacterium sp. SyP6R]MCF4124538.1 isochorismatase family protein [Methylobacterium sp. SyP6R]